jgi:hypothetical protein
MLVFYDRLKQSRLSHLYALLPPSSWHMTIFEGVTEMKRKPNYWPNNLAMDASLEECTAHFEEALSNFDLQTRLPYRLKVVGMANYGLGLHIEPHPADEATTRKLRDRLADCLQFRHPRHDSYRLHISWGYLLRYLSKEQKVELAELFADHFRGMPRDFELGAPELCTFEDMSAYKSVLCLENRDSGSDGTVR